MAAYFPADEVDAVCDRYRAIYAELGPPGSSLLPGAADAFAAVRGRGGVTLVITAKYEPNAHRCLDHVGLAADHVVGWRHGPQKAETLLEHGAHVYVGDTLPDIDARPAGAGAGRRRGHRARSRPTSSAAAGADVVLDALTEFPAWLDTLGLIPADPPAAGRRASARGAASATSAAAYPVRVLLST